MTDQELADALVEKGKQLEQLLLELGELAQVAELALERVHEELGVQGVCSSCGQVGHLRCLP